MLWLSILALEGNFMLSEANKHLICHNWHTIQHSACGGITIAKVWMGDYHEFSDNKKFPNALASPLEDVIFPVIRSQGYMVKTPASSITWQNKSMLVTTDHVEALYQDIILTHSNNSLFFIFKSVFHLPSIWYH